MKMSRTAARLWRPTRMWPDRRKIEAFDELYSLASARLANIKHRGGSDDDDDREAIYEEVMELLGDDIWDVINALLG